MMKRRIMATVLLLSFCCLLMLWFAEDCHAEENDYLQKKGIEGLFSGKGGTDPRSPKGWQKALGIGAFFVTFAVIKWL